MELPWVYADFHNADEHGRLRLDGPATREDLARMETFTDEVMRGLLAQSLGTAIFDGRGWRDAGAGPGSAEGEFVDWLTIHDQPSSVVADVRRIRNHPLVPPDVPDHGYIYHVTTGCLVEVSEATEAGRAR
jgi:carbonic anhydrase